MFGRVAPAPPGTANPSRLTLPPSGAFSRFAAASRTCRGWRPNLITWAMPGSPPMASAQAFRDGIVPWQVPSASASSAWARPGDPAATALAFQVLRNASAQRDLTAIDKKRETMRRPAAALFSGNLQLSRSTARELDLLAVEPAVGRDAAPPARLQAIAPLLPEAR